MATPAPRVEHAASREYYAGDIVAQKYELEEVLGEGGMGTVWLARNLSLDAHVALKLIRRDLNDQGAAERLLKEARAAARIEQHRAVVRIFDFGETEQRDPFIVMELLEGRTLDDLLTEQGRIDPATAVGILLPIIDGLAQAHTAGVVHRDLKPSNIFLARDGRHVQPKVVDFGIAKFESFDAAATRVGAVLGTPTYMAPEQARGLADVDHRADVWTLCAVLYEAVTGSAAFSGDNYNAVLLAVIEGDVSPIMAQGVPDAELWGIIERGLTKDRASRWSNMRALGKALARWLVEKGVSQDITGASVEAAWLVDDQTRDDHESVLTDALLLAPAARRAFGSHGSGREVAEPDGTESKFAVVRATPALGRPRLPVVVASIAGGIALAVTVMMCRALWAPSSPPSALAASPSAFPEVAASASVPSVSAQTVATESPALVPTPPAPSLVPARKEAPLLTQNARVDKRVERRVPRATGFVDPRPPASAPDARAPTVPSIASTVVAPAPESPEEDDTLRLKPPPRTPSASGVHDDTDMGLKEPY